MLRDRKHKGRVPPTVAARPTSRAGQSDAPDPAQTAGRQSTDPLSTTDEPKPARLPGDTPITTAPPMPPRGAPARRTPPWLRIALIVVCLGVAAAGWQFYRSETAMSPAARAGDDLAEVKQAL